MKPYKSLSHEELKKKLKAFSKVEQNDINSYMDYRKSRGLTSESKLRDVKSGIIRLRVSSQKPLKELTIQEVVSLASKIRDSEYGDYSKNEAITNLKRYIKWSNPSLNLEDIRLIKNPLRQKEIKVSDLPTKEEVEKLISHETKMFWKAFLITQYEGGLRTKEVRFLKWSDVTLNSDGDISEVSVLSTKTKKARCVFIEKATFYLKKLKEQQDNLEIRGEYIFRSKTNPNAPVSRAVVSMWMTRLSKRVLGRNCNNYLLRHSRGNQLYQLAKQNKISKDTALAFMGHSKEMSKVYTHDRKEEIKKMLKDQVYNIEEISEEDKNEVKKLKKEIEDMRKAIREEADYALKEIAIMKKQNAMIKKQLAKSQK